MSDAVEKLSLSDSGQMTFFRLIPAPGISDGDASAQKKFPKIETAAICDPEIYALAETAFACLGRFTEAGVAQAIALARKEFLKARFHCAIMELSYQHSPNFPTSDDTRAQFRSWERAELSSSVASLAEFMVKPLLQPKYAHPNGAAFELMRWLSTNFDLPGQISDPDYFSSLGLAIPELMAAAAIAWVDEGMAATKKSERVRLVAQAGQALAHTSLHTRRWLAAAAKHGRDGALQKHALTNEVKEWALREAVSLRGPEMKVARELVTKLPIRLAAASVNPERLIYETLRAARKAEKAKKLPG